MRCNDDNSIFEIIRVSCSTSRFCIIIFTLTFLACGQKNTTCSNNKHIQIGNVSLILPDCYELVFQDSVNHPTDAIIIKDKNIKLNLHLGGLGTLPVQDSSVTLQVDTINKNYLRQIGYFTKQDKFGFVINIVDIRPNTLFNSLNLSDTTLNSHQYNYELTAGTNENVSLTNEEKDIFLKAFSKSIIIEK